MYTHCQHTFQFKQLVKVHVALYDPFKVHLDIIYTVSGPNKHSQDALDLNSCYCNVIRVSSMQC